MNVPLQFEHGTRALYKQGMRDYMRICIKALEKADMSKEQKELVFEDILTRSEKTFNERMYDA